MVVKYSLQTGRGLWWQHKTPAKGTLAMIMGILSFMWLKRKAEDFAAVASCWRLNGDQGASLLRCTIDKEKSVNHGLMPIPRGEAGRSCMTSMDAVDRPRVPQEFHAWWKGPSQMRNGLSAYFTVFLIHVSLFVPHQSALSFHIFFLHKIFLKVLLEGSSQVSSFPDFLFILLYLECLSNSQFEWK